jgi:hypothetical protein
MRVIYGTQLLSKVNYKPIFSFLFSTAGNRQARYVINAWSLIHRERQ